MIALTGYPMHAGHLVHDCAWHCSCSRPAGERDCSTWSKINPKEEPAMSDDTRDKRKGHLDEAKGRGKQTLGDAKDTAGDLKDKVTDSLS